MINETTGEPLAYSVREFCKTHSISVAHYYKLRKLGLGPQEMKLGGRRLVWREAAAAWRAARTQTKEQTGNEPTDATRG